VNNPDVLWWTADRHGRWMAMTDLKRTGVDSNWIHSDWLPRLVVVLQNGHPLRSWRLTEFRGEPASSADGANAISLRTFCCLSASRVKLVTNAVERIRRLSRDTLSMKLLITLKNRHGNSHRRSISYFRIRSVRREWGGRGVGGWDMQSTRIGSGTFLRCCNRS